MSATGDAHPRNVAILLAGLGGRSGNGARLLEHAAPFFEGVSTDVRVLAEDARFAAHAAALSEADGFVFVTGTYWDGWSSHLQRFLEEATPSEATPLWLGKPAAVWVTGHSVGGKAVLSRLQGVLSTFGCAIPPMTGLVVTRANELARAHDPEGARDLFGPADLEIAVHNLRVALAHRDGYRAWDVDRGDPSERWLKAPDEPQE